MSNGSSQGNTTIQSSEEHDTGSMDMEGKVEEVEDNHSHRQQRARLLCEILDAELSLELAKIDARFNSTCKTVTEKNWDAERKTIKEKIHLKNLKKQLIELGYEID